MVTHSCGVSSRTPQRAIVAWVARRWKVGVVGCGAGLMNGLIGMGGGSIVVPGLIWARGMAPKHAVVTSLGAVFLLSGYSFVLHAWLGGPAQGVPSLLALVGMGALGAQVGSRLLLIISNRWLLLSFATFCLFCAQYLMASALGWVHPIGLSGGDTPMWGLVLVGLASGFSSGLFGIGGGLIAILALTLVFNTPVPEAIMAALFMNIANSSSALTLHMARRNCPRSVYGNLLALVPMALLGAGIGSVLSAHLPSGVLKITFGLFVVYVALSMIRRGLRQHSATSPGPAGSPHATPGAPREAPQGNPPEPQLAAQAVSGET